MDLIKMIKQGCMDEGISMSRLCKKQGIRSETISRYQKKLPIPLTVVTKLLTELEAMKAKRLNLKHCSYCGEIYPSSKAVCPQCKNK